MSTRALTFAIMLLGASASGGCEQDSSQPPALEEDQDEDEEHEGEEHPENEAVALELARFPRRLTRSETAVSNLNGHIEALEAALERAPGSVIHGTQLVSAWLSRSQFLGTYEDFSRADEVTRALIASAHKDPAAHVLRASFLSSVHRFEDAEAALARAAELGDVSATSKATTYDLARGRDLEHVLELRTDALEKSKSFVTLTEIAAAEAVLGRFEKAEAHYVEALGVYRDVSPLPIAWVYFQRGVMWGEMANQPAAARILYEEAVRILPEYVAANVHLAEREHADGDVETALARLERIAPGTTDPEPESRLSQYLSELQPERADELRREADEGYTALVREHPQAFLDHASEFYANAGGDPERALELALENLTSRTNARAYIVALQAAVAANEAARWCELAAEAAGGPANANRNLEELLHAPAFECEK
jgi:tetratricopeptide (TPR) repeat protein